MRRILIVSTCIEEWGGSEELWGRSVPLLQAAGFHISVVKDSINKIHPEFKRLSESGVSLLEVNPHLGVFKRYKNLFGKVFRKTAEKLHILPYQGENFEKFKGIVVSEAPSLVLISQGINFDGLKLAYQCFLLGVPYVVLAQKAVDFYWPLPYDRGFMLNALQNAKKCYFVSNHNLRLTEEQFGERLPNAEVIYNPIKLSRNVVPYPKSDETFKLACVGRLFLLDKGQDIVIRIMAEQKWKNRPLHVSFFGKGLDKEGLQGMANLLGVTKIDFKGQIDDVGSIWNEYHALILASRSEGLPLSIVEAMSAGRIAITSDAGGNKEVVQDGINGFVGAPYEPAFDDAMERAWQKRDKWKEMGENAALYVKNHFPVNPEKYFVSLIVDLIK